MAATIVATPQHAFHPQSTNGSPSYMDTFNDPWRRVGVSHTGNTTSQASYGNTTTSGSHLMRTDVFPQFSDAADCSPRSASTTSSSPSSYLGHYTSTTTNGGTTQVVHSTTLTSTGSSGMDHSDDSADGHLDFSATFSATLPSPATPGVEWSTTGLPTTTFELPSQSLLQMHRDDSLIGKSIGFEALSSEIDAAPATAAPVKTPQPADLFGSQPLAFDVSSLASPDSTGTDLGYNFDLATPGLTTIIGAIPTTHHATLPTPLANGYLPSTETVDDEPDASSVSDVDAASDAWSEVSDPRSPAPAVAPLSPISSIVRVAPIAPGTTSVNPNAALALRPGPYTRGRAAALAAPAARELKPVPVARGPHAGLLGGGEMATVGIYTKDDRWRKIERLREKRRARIVVKSSGGQYACRKSFADRRPRVGGRFVKMDEETKRYLSLTKPGAAPAAAALPTPAALVAYAHQQQESAARAAAAAAAAVHHPATSSAVPATHYNSQLAVAAHAASTASPMMPLFGSNTTSLPPAPSFPAPPVNTTSGGLWFGSDYTTSA